MNAYKKITKIVILTLMITTSMMIPVLSARNNNPNKWLGSPTYVLNIHGKKADWNANGDSI